MKALTDCMDIYKHAVIDVLLEERTHMAWMHVLRSLASPSNTSLSQPQEYVSTITLSYYRFAVKFVAFATTLQVRGLLDHSNEALPDWLDVCEALKWDDIVAASRIKVSDV